MDKQSAIDKIRKCLALSQSANEHEAAAALRQARSLMEKFSISDMEMLASGVSESSAKAGAKNRPANWEAALADTVSQAFDCQLVFVAGWRDGHWHFIGHGAAPEVAQYAFAVLLRQARKSRAAFMQAECKRLKTASKTRRADLFCVAWVRAIQRQVQQFAGTPVDSPAIEAYMAAHYGECSALESRNRNAGRKLKDRDHDAWHAGFQSGRDAQLMHGIGGKDGRFQLPAA
ncbi:DUF2786 domain-containing protein [Laribacter hongkongensis]|uniref:DUF2786 domain-containing protein n=1 Tax=Laribacter hongkongensis TaxID=168471 RepID=UPI001EFD4D47|nr:DUF2786 domain-containing protein [Laribacter hongkongensis]MCG8996676.1 DUF2786 domain-containing protein [Laribacter hongkongensis]MCG9011955.1 DUF2786 domain-containing protein [Laribacter hongkongensis]MCG9024246.1 DUF2786 domain-containing protein [Laribacter hongkongensis]MCG9048408.1 DUF2786 domain-containing protein [Laribacter hongkongensis]MCG9075336.1 DUF2786 domain-containing protein [Laribacter hongkongensis]